MQYNRNRRTYGTGSIIEKGGAYHGKFRVGGRQVMRKLGAVRKPGTREGLTKTQAEARLRKLMDQTTYVVPAARVTFEDVADQYIVHAEHVMGRKHSTVQDYRIMVARHLGPHFAAKAIDRVTADDVAAYMAAKRDLAAKTVSNHLVFAHAVFRFAVKRGLVGANPVAVVDRPRPNGADPDFRFLAVEELEALLRATADENDRALYLTAAMTGLRQGELVALRWRDVDWPASVIRVRRNYTRGAEGTPKSRRSSRAVPMADRMAGELERHFQRSAYQGDDDLVFCHPQTGRPHDASRMRTRFYAAMKAAKLGHLVGRENGITFHSLRHTFGTRMAAVGVPMRTLQEWMGHRDFATTLIYADYSPDPAAATAFAQAAFGPSTNPSTNLRPTQTNSDPLEPSEHGESPLGPSG
jgi:integrase